MIPGFVIDIFAAIAISVGSKLAERLIVAVLARKAKNCPEKIDEMAEKAKSLPPNGKAS